MRFRSQTLTVLQIGKFYEDLKSTKISTFIINDKTFSRNYMDMLEIIGEYQEFLIELKSKFSDDKDFHMIRSVNKKQGTVKYEAPNFI